MAAWNPAKAGTWRFLPVQAALGRVPGPPWPAGWPGFRGVPKGSKSRKVAILATLLVPSRTGPDSRLGPPEFTEKPENTRKHGEHGKTRFLRVTRATGRPCHIEAIVATSGSPPASWRWPSVLLRDLPPGRSLQSLRSTLHPRRVKRTVRGLLEPSSLSQGEGFASPLNPHPIVGPQAGLLHCGFSPP